MEIEVKTPLLRNTVDQFLCSDLKMSKIVEIFLTNSKQQ